MAQNSVTVMGSVTPCSGTSYPVWIFSDPGTTPAVDTVINSTVNCTYSYTFHPTNASGGLSVLLSCDGGTTWAWGTSDSAAYTAPIDTLVMNLVDCSVSGCQASFTVQQAMNGNTPTPWHMTTTNTSTGYAPVTYQWFMPNGTLNTDAEPSFTFTQPGTYPMCLTITSDSGYCTSTHCDTVVVDSLGLISTSGVWYDCAGIQWGLNLPGTPCTTLLGGEGTWSDACVCVENNPAPCQANFYAAQAYTDSTTDPNGSMEPIPNEVWVWNLSTGGNGDTQYLWNFGDGSSSTEAYPTHDYDGDGPWDLCLTITTDSCMDSYCDSVSVDANGILNGLVIEGHHADQNQRTNGFTLNVQQGATSGIAQAPAIADLRLWPNPAQNELNLTFNKALSGTVSVTVIDPRGRMVISESHNLNAGSNTLQLNTGSLEPGLYMVRMGNAAHSVTHRFMKLR